MFSTMTLCTYSVCKNEHCGDASSSLKSWRVENMVLWGQFSLLVAW